MHEAEQSPIDTWTKNTQPTDCFLWPARRCKAVMPVPADQAFAGAAALPLLPLLFRQRRRVGDCR
jgi:hypothetical protein